MRRTADAGRYHGRRGERAADTQQKNKKQKKGQSYDPQAAFKPETRKKNAIGARWLKEGTKEKQYNLRDAVLVMIVTVLTVYLKQTPLMSHSG